jgi:hypothetical protein
MKHVSILPVVLLLLAGRAHAQTPAPQEAVRQFADMINRNSTTVYVGSSVTMRVEARVGQPEGCILPLTRTITEDRDAPTREETRLDLSLATPVVRVVPSDKYMAASLYLDTSSGENDFVGTRFNPPPTGPVTGRNSWHELSFPTEELARSAARLAEAAIRACGGRPRNAQADAAAREREAVRTGNDPETNRLKEQCRRMVRTRLSAPEEAQFTADADWLTLRSEEKGEVTVSGEVTGTNRAGGRVTNTFFCTFERSGDAWIPQGAPLII